MLIITEIDGTRCFYPFGTLNFGFNKLSMEICESLVNRHAFRTLLSEHDDGESEVAIFKPF